MKRINIFLLETQIAFLTHLGGTLSEHIRSAVTEYIQKIKDHSISASKSKGGNNG